MASAPWAGTALSAATDSYANTDLVLTGLAIAAAIVIIAFASAPRPIADIARDRPSVPISAHGGASHMMPMIACAGRKPQHLALTQYFGWSLAVKEFGDDGDVVVGAGEQQ